MENIEKKAEALDKITKGIEHRPWAYIIVILVVYSFLIYKIAKNSNANYIRSLERDKERCGELTNELLIRNNIIREQKEKIEEKDRLIKYADSTTTKVIEKLK